MKFPLFAIVEHPKTGSRYVIVGTPEKFRLDEFNTPAYAYRLAHDSSATIRVLSQTRMEDGRFVLAAAPAL